MLVPAGPGDDAFAACLRLFRQYPLAVRRHYAEHRYGSLVLLSRPAGDGPPRFYVLIMERDELFVLRSWDRRDGARAEIGPGLPAPDGVPALLADSVPVPRDGTLLGWLADGQVRAVLAAYGRLPEPWDDPSAVPGILVLPRAGSQPGQWPPPMAASPLGDARLLWTYLARGQLADLGPLVAGHPGRVFWVPGGPGAADPVGRPSGARIVVTERLASAGLWLPAGVYADHWALREGAAGATASQLLALPGVADLSGRGVRPLENV